MSDAVAFACFRVLFVAHNKRMKELLHEHIVTLFNLNYGVAVEKSIPPEKKQSFDEPETILEERKQSFMHLLKGLGFKPKTAAHVLALYQHYGTQQCFTRSDVAEALNVTTAPATVLMRKMKEASLIELANGKSRGAYRFKQMEP